MPMYMLWYEENPQHGFAEALRRAAEYYHQKYGRWPNLVEAPLFWTDEVQALKERWQREGKNGIAIEVRGDVLPRHLALTFLESKKDGV